MRKILFCIPDLRGGGAERVFVHLMNNLDRGRFVPELALFRKRGAFLEELAGDVAVHDLDTDLKGALAGFPRLVRRVSPDAVISTMSYTNMVAGFASMRMRRRGVIFLGRETGIPSLRSRIARSPWNARWLYRWSYRYLDRVICQSADMLADVHEIYRVPLDRMVTIPNPVDVAWIRARAAAGVPGGFGGGELNVVAVGRLHRQKGFDLLLRAAARLKGRGVRLHVLGDGALREELSALAAELGVEGEVVFHGFLPNPYPLVAAADLFVLSSRYEGFPNAMVEALALGRPVVAFDCPGGINELVERGVNGEIVPLGDTEAMAEAILRVAAAGYDRERIAAVTAERYGIDTIVGRYERLFEGNFGTSRPEPAGAR